MAVWSRKTAKIAEAKLRRKPQPVFSPVPGSQEDRLLRAIFFGGRREREELKSGSLHPEGSRGSVE